MSITAKKKLSDWTKYFALFDKTGGGPAPKEPTKLNVWDEKILQAYGTDANYKGIYDSSVESATVLTKNTQLNSKWEIFLHRYV